MKFREKLGDWISGGKLSECSKEYHSSILSMAELEDECIRIRIALAKIERQQTPGANATVTRMARIAREALGY